MGLEDNAKRKAIGKILVGFQILIFLAIEGAISFFGFGILINGWTR